VPPSAFSLKNISINSHEDRFGLPSDSTADIEVSFAGTSGYLSNNDGGGLMELQKIVFFPASEYKLPQILGKAEQGYRCNGGTNWRVYEIDTETGAKKMLF